MTSKMMGLGYPGGPIIDKLARQGNPEAYTFAKTAFELSERFDTPVILRMCTRIAHSQSIVELGEKEPAKLRDYEKNPQKYIMMPGNAKKRHPIVEERTNALIEYAETAEINRFEDGEDKLVGFITSSTSYQYVKEVFGDKYPVLKLGMIYPMPVNLLKDFAAKVDKLYVIEELDPEYFFRISRGSIVSMKAIDTITKQLGGRLRLEVHPAPSFEMTVSRSRVDDFLAWLER